MPIQRPPSDGSKNGLKGRKSTSSKNDENLSPLQRYLAKKQADEKKILGLDEKSQPPSGGSFDQFRSKLESMREKAKGLLGQQKDYAPPDETRVEPSSKSSARDRFKSHAPEVSPVAPPPMPPPPVSPAIEAGVPSQPPPPAAPFEPMASVPQERIVPGRFWPRFIAYLLDFFIVSAGVSLIDKVGFVPLRFVFGPDIMGLDDNLRFVAWHVLAFFYYGWFYSTKGASPGKLVLQLEVVDAHNGQKLGYWRSFLRESLGKYISWILLAIGFIIAALRSDKRALHDLIFETQVVHKSRP